MDVGIISLIISVVVSIIQGLTFLTHRKDKNDERFNNFVSKEDFNGMKHLETSLAAKVISLHTDIEVLKNKVDNEIHMTSKSLDKLDEHMNQLLGNKCKTD